MTSSLWFVKQDLLRLILLFLWLTVVSSQATPYIRIETVIKGITPRQLNSSVLEGAEALPIVGSTSFDSDSGIAGELMVFSPLDACSSLTRSMYTTSTGAVRFLPSDPTSYVIAIAYMGNCSIERKLEVVDYTPNVAGLILVSESNQLPSDLNVDVFGIQLTAFMVQFDDGSILIKLANFYRQNRVNDALLKNSSTLDVSLTPSVTGTSEAWLKATLYFSGSSAVIGLVEFSLVVVVVLLTIAFITSVVLHCYFYHNRHNNGPNEVRSHGQETELSNLRRSLVSPSMLNLLPIHPYIELKKKSSMHFLSAPAEANEKDTEILSSSSLTESEMIVQMEGLQESYVEVPLHSSPSISHIHVPSPTTSYATLDSRHRKTSIFNDMCPICLEEFMPKDQLRELPCHHIYHPSCIDPWLTVKSSRCPMCKLNILEILSAKTNRRSAGCDRSRATSVSSSSSDSSSRSSVNSVSTTLTVSRVPEAVRSSSQPVSQDDSRQEGFFHRLIHGFRRGQFSFSQV